MGDGITISEIADRVMMQQSALSRALASMEGESYLRRVPRRDDGRFVEVVMSGKGRALFGALDIVVAGARCGCCGVSHGGTRKLRLR